MFNYIYIVHYSPLIDRKNNLIKQFKDNNIVNYEFLSEYDRNSISKEVINKYYKLDNLSHAQICITITHIEIYKKILENKFKLCLILEDDALLDIDFLKKLNYYIDNLPNDFDIGFINSGCGMHIKDTNNEQIWYKFNYSRTCCAYLITDIACKKLIDSIIPFNDAIDHELNAQINKLKLNSYWCEPTIVKDGSECKYEKSHKY